MPGLAPLTWRDGDSLAALCRLIVGILALKEDPLPLVRVDYSTQAAWKVVLQHLKGTPVFQPSGSPDTIQDRRRLNDVPQGLRRGDRGPEG